ncbi:MAG: hypothetical protein HC790_06990, partial [Acaryochloridaceae cyanobacterium CSU_3_4]|nr:hypothetical protein [Acaryochloridaceae cyanobacterium CSU_3_4]
MYLQFRTQYPTGSLTSELLKAEPDHYIVRAIIQVGETTLATGLSAAATVEEAEDHARWRALMVLGMVSSPEESQAHLVAAKAPAQLQPASTDLQATANRALDALSEWEFSEPKAEVEEEGIPARPRSVNGNRRVPDKLTSGTSKRKLAQASVARPPALEEISSSPVDLSEIIAQTDVELKRLGWTNTEGQRYLQQTYNK